MRNKIFMYLFIFSLVMILFMFMNQKKIYESQEEKIENLQVKIDNLSAEKEQLQLETDDLDYFTLQGNDNAMSYFENAGYEAIDIENMVTSQLYDQNTVEGGNPLVPYVGMEGTMKINKIRFLNHKWIIADFTDGTYWGEMIIQYDLSEEEELTLFTHASFLYMN